MTERAKTRAHQAGEQLAEAIAKTVHLMYQKNTARHYFCGLITRLEHLRKEFADRKEAGK